MTATVPLTARPSWNALQVHHDKIREMHLRTLFAEIRSAASA